MAKFDPFLSWIAPGWRAWGRNPRKGRDHILQRSGALVQKPEGPNTYNVKIWLEPCGNHGVQNFQVQYKLHEELTDTEKLMGIDPTKLRTKATLKRLAILRNAIIMSNFRDEVLRWERVLHEVDKVYTCEFAVANRRDKLPSHFKSWDM